jgi:hypothetical protein
MKIRSLFDGYGLTKNKIYDVIFEHDSVYELMIDDGKVYCRNKNFFEIVKQK